jgi:hypothetical protein
VHLKFHLQGKKKQHNLESKIIKTNIVKNKCRKKKKLQNCIQGFIPCWRASCPSLKFEE